MSARIGIINEGNFESIYLYNTSKWDKIGLNLRTGFKKIEQVKQLISGGDLSTLSESFDKCIYYHRDKDDPWTVCKPYLEEGVLKLDDVDTNASPVDYYFIFYNGKWYCSEAYDKNWISLTKFINFFKK